MSAPIRLYSLGPSPNSKKVRLALGLKGIPHEVVNVDPADRSSIIEMSGQPLTPVLTHGDTVVFDSAAILRYLEANVKREPRLFSADYETMKKIEGWESWVRNELAPGIGKLFGQYFAPARDEKVVSDGVRQVNEAARHVDSSLGSGGWLVGNAPTAADLTAASFLSLGFLPEAAASSHPILAYFRSTLTIDPEMAGVRRWYEEIDRHDQ